MRWWGARWPGRFQVEHVRGTTWIFDVAHNPAGVEALGTTLDGLDLPRPLVVVAATLGALLTVVYILTKTEGGLGGFIDLAQANEKLKMVNWTWDYTVASLWVVIIGNIFANLISYASDQSTIQRYMTTETEAKAARSIWRRAAQLQAEAERRLEESHRLPATTGREAVRGDGLHPDDVRAAAEEAGVLTLNQRIEAGAARQRQVQRFAGAFSAAGLVGMAPEERIVGRRVGVDRREQNVGALVENVLRAVAVVIVDVEDRDPQTPRSERRFGSDRDIVEVGIAAEIICASMMAWRAAERVCNRLATGDQVGKALAQAAVQLHFLALVSKNEESD